MTDITPTLIEAVANAIANDFLRQDDEEPRVLGKDLRHYVSVTGSPDLSSSALPDGSVLL